MNITGITDAVVSHAMASGLFERVNQHEPKNAPGNGMSCAIWAQKIGPAIGASGLNNTTGIVTFNVQLYLNMTLEPQDSIDQLLLGAVDILMTAYSGDFDLGATIRNVDLMGQFGDPLSAQAGYLNQDSKVYRVMTITLPLVVNDVWAQSP